MSDTFLVPTVLREEITEEEKKALDESQVTDFEKRQKILDAERNARRAAAAAAAAPSSSTSEPKAAPIGSSETQDPSVSGTATGQTPVISDQLRGLIPGLGAPKPSDATPESTSASAPPRGFADVPDLLEDIRESVARIQDRSFLIDQKQEYPPRAPPVEPVVAPDELCSRRYGFCRTIPMILTDISFHLRAIATVPTRQQLLNDAENGTSPFQKSLPPSAPAAPLVQGPQRPPFAQGQQRPPFAQGQQRPPFKQGPRPPFAQGERGPPPRNPPGPDPDVPVPKPNSDAPPQVDGDNNNDDAGDGLDESPQRGGADEDDDWEAAYGGDIPDAELDEYDLDLAEYADAGLMSEAAAGTGPPEDPGNGDGYYKIVTITPPDPM